MNCPALIRGLALSCLLLASTVSARQSLASERLHDDAAELDRQVAKVLMRLDAADMVTATHLADRLAREFPAFALGKLLHAELQSTAALDTLRTGNGDGWPQALTELLLEARTRLGLARAAIRGRWPTKDSVPAALVRLDDAVSDVLLVDLGRSELLHFKVESGEPTLSRRHYVASGSAGFGKSVEGDLMTPLGVYLIDGFRPDHRLPDLYGSGALTLDYPNQLDRVLGRTGSGIWLHGVPHARSSRSPRSSEGCVSMSNDHLVTLVDEIARQSTLVVLAAEVDWITVAERNRRQAAYDRYVDSATIIEVPTESGVQHLALSAPPMTGKSRRIRFVRTDSSPARDRATAMAAMPAAAASDGDSAAIASQLFLRP